MTRRPPPPARGRGRRWGRWPAGSSAAGHAHRQRTRRPAPPAGRAHRLWYLRVMPGIGSDDDGAARRVAGILPPGASGAADGKNRRPPPPRQAPASAHPTIGHPAPPSHPVSPFPAHGWSATPSPCPARGVPAVRRHEIAVVPKRRPAGVRSHVDRAHQGARRPGPGYRRRSASSRPSRRRASIRVVVVVGPVESQTASYIADGKALASPARSYGAAVTEIYSPNATWAKVRAAAKGADLLIYLGHGNGWPSPHAPYSATTKDGLGLNASAGHGNSNNKYYGASYLVSSGGFRLAANAVVILNHLCYSAGNSEPGDPLPSKSVAEQRIANYGETFYRSGPRRSSPSRATRPPTSSPGCSRRTRRCSRSSGLRRRRSTRTPSPSPHRRRRG